MNRGIDDAAFKRHVAARKFTPEETSCLEIFTYSDPSLNSTVEQPLSDENWGDFLHRLGGFAPAILPDHVYLVAGMRLILQLNATHPETFSGMSISLKPKDYVEMIEALHLPRIAIESSSGVGPLFWYALEHNDDGGDSRLEIIFRKADVNKANTRGWEVALSHEFSTSITTGFCKGTATSDMVQCIRELRDCVSEIGHAMLLPMLIIGTISSCEADLRQRDARESLRKLEATIAFRERASDTGHTAGGSINLDIVNRDLIECHRKVLWYPPNGYLQLIGTIREAAELFKEMLPNDRKSPIIARFQRSIGWRLSFYEKRWKGIESYTNITKQRLDVQTDLLNNIMAQRESRLNLQIAADQKKLANTSKRESTAVKGISLLGAVFLPGAFVASIFSTSFFDFKDAQDLASVVSPRFWLYWAVAIPFTLVVVGLYFLWETRRQIRYQREDESLEMEIDTLEMEIMRSIKERWFTGARGGAAVKSV